MLLDGVNHIAVLSHDVQRLGEFYRTVFDAVVHETKDHGPGETMTDIGIGPGTSLNVFVIDGNTEADRQTPMWQRGRLDHLGLSAASREAFDEIRKRLIAVGASDGQVNDFGGERSNVLPRSGRLRGRGSPAEEQLTIGGGSWRYTAMNLHGRGDQAAGLDQHWWSARPVTSS